jgi:hypothetical protein
MKWEKGIDVARAINELVDAKDNEIMNRHNCRMHDSTMSCNRTHELNVFVLDAKRKLLNVLTR